MPGSRPSRYEHTRCLRRGWVFERAGWLAIAVAVAAAMLGIFGGGWFSRVEVKTGGALTVEYSRVSRARSPDVLRVNWRPRGEQSELWITRAYLEDFEIKEIRPAPAAVSIDHDRIYYTFRTREPAARAEVRFILKPERGGTIRGRVGCSNGLEVDIRQFVFP